MKTRKICVVGVGGVGGYFGGLLAKAAQDTGAHSIHFIARGEHGRAIRERGLLVKTDGGQGYFTARPATCSETAEGLGHCDAVILAVKGYDLDGAVDLIRDVVSGDTFVLPLLNGIDIRERVSARLGRGTVLPACTYVGTHIERPGVVSQAGGACRIVLGPDPLQPGVCPGELLSLFDASGVRYEWRPDIRTAVWSKFLFIASFGLVTARYGKTLGEVLETAVLRESTLAVMREIETLSKRENADLPSDIVETSMATARQFPYGTKTSLQRDVEAGKRHEGAGFGGVILRLGEKHGLPTPETARIYGELESAGKTL